jgi:hypothetical protein
MNMYTAINANAGRPDHIWPVRLILHTSFNNKHLAPAYGGQFYPASRFHPLHLNSFFLIILDNTL